MYCLNIIELKFQKFQNVDPSTPVLVTSAMAIYLIVCVGKVFKQEQWRLELIWQTRQNTASLFSMLVLVVCALMEVLIWSVFAFCLFQQKSSLSTIAACLSYSDSVDRMRVHTKIVALETQYPEQLGR